MWGRGWRGGDRHHRVHGTEEEVFLVGCLHYLNKTWLQLQDGRNMISQDAKITVRSR